MFDASGGPSSCKSTGIRQELDERGGVRQVEMGETMEGMAEKSSRSDWDVGGTTKRTKG